MIYLHIEIHGPAPNSSSATAIRSTAKYGLHAVTTLMSYTLQIFPKQKLLTLDVIKHYFTMR